MEGPRHPESKCQVVFCRLSNAVVGLGALWARGKRNVKRVETLKSLRGVETKPCGEGGSVLCARVCMRGAGKLERGWKE